MGQFPILPSSMRLVKRELPGMPDTPLPEFYMEDFTILGLLVSRCDEAVRILKDSAFNVVQTSGGAEVVIQDSDHMQRAFSVLNDRGIDCELADVAEQMYQG